PHSILDSPASDPIATPMKGDRMRAKRTLLSALMVLGPILLVTDGPARGAEGTPCNAEFDLTLAPGLSNPGTSGTFTSGGENGTNEAMFTFGGLQGGLFNGQFDGPKMSGTFQVRPTQGNCVSEPVTKVHVSLKGTLKG